MKSFHHQFVSDPEDAVRYLEAIIEGLRGGELRFSSSGKSITLEPGNILEMSIEAGSRKGKARVALSISWPEDALSRLRQEGGGGTEAGRRGLER